MRKAAAVLVLVALAGSQIVAANAEFERLLIGGTYSDFGTGIFVDSNYIYVVGGTDSFGPNPPNLFLSIFHLDNTHRCSVAVDFGGGIVELGWKVLAYAGYVYVVGYTNYGANPWNILMLKLDTNCNVHGAAVYDVDGSDYPRALTISADGQTLFIAGQSTNGAHLLAVKTSDLSVTWAKLFRVAGEGDIAHSVAFSGNKLYVTGAAAEDLFVSRFDAPTGNHELTKIFTTQQIEQGRDVVVTVGKVYVAGIYIHPSRSMEFLFMRLDATTLNPELVRIYGTTAVEGTSSLSMVGGLVYAVGSTYWFGTQDAMLFAVNPSTGVLSHAFVLTGGGAQFASDSTSTGTCLIYTGFSDNWPLSYSTLDGVVTDPLIFSISSVIPSIATPSITPVTPTPAATPFTPTFDTPTDLDAFYSWFCPDALVTSTATTVTTTTTSTVIMTLTTTTTSTVLTTSTYRTTITSVVGVTSTVYDVRTTTITQTSITTTTQTQSTTTTQTQTQTQTTILTQSTTYSTTTTLSKTLTHSTTTILSTTTTIQHFAEPVTTYAILALLSVIAALQGASLVVGRRRSFPY